MEANKRRCIIGIKKGISPNGHEYGWVLESLNPCCKTFEKWFENTGNHKKTFFNQPNSKENNGFCLVTRGSLPTLVLRVDIEGGSPRFPSIREDEVNYCLFCSTKIEIRTVKIVELRKRTREIPDGFEEVVLHPKPELEEDPATKLYGVRSDL